ncbi:Sir2 silent information regulator family NAD-dependent deacetylase [Lactobacillus gallinarum]|nr:Sir2 silent information regulator family NAD-dependent deacetylase [Lactobacillus gallinarum]
MNKIDELIKHVKDADAIVVGAGSGMSRATGLAFWYENSPLYMDNMKYFAKKYGFNGLFQGFYNRFESEEEHWAFLLELYKMMNEIPPQKPTYEYLKNLIGDKPVHYVTTNQDMLFTKYFPENEVSEIQGSWHYFQSSRPMSERKLYPTKGMLDVLYDKIENHRLPSKLIPKSDVDGAPLIPWVRGPEFLEDQKYYEEHAKWNKFMADHKGEKILFLEMGVGRMTPMFIQEPFWEMTQYMPDSFYININPQDARTNPAIQDRSLLIGEDINEALKEANEKIKGGKND